MKSLLFSLVIFVTTVGCRAASTDTVSLAEQKVVEIHMSSKAPLIQEQSKRHGKVVTLPLASGTCSGSFVDSTGDILTARHCVNGFDAFEVVTSDEQHYTAVFIASSSIHDLALIHVDRRNTPHFSPAQTVVRGQTVFVLGSPLGLTNTLSTGVVAKFDGDATLLDCGVLPGNSGGPVFDADGKLVGVVNAGFIVMSGMTHLNMAQGLDAVVLFVREVLDRAYGLN